MSKLKVLPNDSGGQSPGGHYRINEATVDLSSEDDVKKWANNLGISTKEFRLAAEHYGTVIRDIRRGLLQEKNQAS